MKRYKYRFDRRSHRITGVVITVVLMIGLLVSYYATTSYFSAWIIANISAIIILYVLSIPRYVKVTAKNLEIHCVVELTEIKRKEIVSARKIGRAEMRYCLPVLGSYGFFGYYGYYYDFRRWDLIKVYASEWNNFVEIEDKYEQIYVISCADADDLISHLRTEEMGHE